MTPPPSTAVTALGQVYAEATGKVPPVSTRKLVQLARDVRLPGAFRAENGRWRVYNDAIPQIIRMMLAEDQVALIRAELVAA